MYSTATVQYFIHDFSELRSDKSEDNATANYLSEENAVTVENLRTGVTQQSNNVYTIQ